MAAVEIVDWERVNPGGSRKKLSLDIGPLSFSDGHWKERKAMEFNRLARDKNYCDVKIVISKLHEFIGRNYVTFKGEATYKHTDDQKVIQQDQGDCIILFFPRKEDKKEA
jgi:hypothetical protein